MDGPLTDQELAAQLNRKAHAVYTMLGSEHAREGSEIAAATQWTADRLRLGQARDETRVYAHGWLEQLEASEREFRTEVVAAGGTLACD